MSEQTATINGVQVTEAQLREGLAQIERRKAVEAARSCRAITVLRDQNNVPYINIPPAVAADIVKRAQTWPDEYVTLHVDGKVWFNYVSGNARTAPLLKGFTS